MHHGHVDFRKGLTRGRELLFSFETQGKAPFIDHTARYTHPLVQVSIQRVPGEAAAISHSTGPTPSVYRGTPLTRDPPPPHDHRPPSRCAYCRVLGGRGAPYGRDTPIPCPLPTGEAGLNPAASAQTVSRKVLGTYEYMGYSKLRTRAVLGSYSRAMPRSIGPP